MRISDWSSDVCSSDLRRCQLGLMAFLAPLFGERLAFPFLHRRMREHMIDPSRSGAGVEAIGAVAEGDGREEGVHGRSEERLVGKECVMKCRLRWWLYQ